MNMKDNLHFYLEQLPELVVESGSSVSVPDDYTDEVIREVFHDMTGKEPDTIIPIFTHRYKQCIFN